MNHCFNSNTVDLILWQDSENTGKRFVWVTEEDLWTWMQFDMYEFLLSWRWIKIFFKLTLMLFCFSFFPPQGCTVQYFNNSEIKIYCVYNIHGINQKLLLFWECVWERGELPPDFPWEACKGTGRQKPHREMYANPQDSVDFCIHCGWPRMSAASYPLRSNFCS